MSRLRPITTSDPASAEARLVRLVRPPPPMSAAQAARCKERVTEVAKAPPVVSKTWSPLATLGAALAVVAAGGVVIVASQTHDASLRSGPVQAQALPPNAPDTRAPEASEAVPAVSIDSLPSAAATAARGPKRDALPAVAVAAPPPRSASSETGTADDVLTRELRLVDGARVELTLRPSHAHDLLIRHAAEFPSGQLASEREVLLVDALIRLGRRADAEARGRALVAREPEGAYARRVEALLSSAPSFERN